MDAVPGTFVFERCITADAIDKEECRKYDTWKHTEHQVLRVLIVHSYNLDNILCPICPWELLNVIICMDADFCGEKTLRRQYSNIPNLYTTNSVLTQLSLCP